MNARLGNAPQRKRANRCDTDLDERSKWNDVELYDLQSDPGEMNNLANDRTKNAALLTTMNGKLEATIKPEIGKDDGRELPDIPKITWGVDRVDL